MTPLFPAITFQILGSHFSKNLTCWKPEPTVQVWVRITQPKAQPTFHALDAALPDHMAFTSPTPSLHNQL